MSTRFFLKGKQNFESKVIDWINDTIKSALLDLVNNTDTAVKAIIGATAATPINVNVTAHGFSVGDIIVEGGVLGNTSANGTYRVKTVPDADHYTLQTINATALDVVGLSAYTSGGWVINLTLANNYADVNACQVSLSGALTGKSDTNGILSASNPTFTAVTNLSISQCMVTGQQTATPASDKLVFFNDGKHLVTIARDVTAADTTVWVEELEAPIASGTVLVFSNGRSLTLSGAAAQFARTLTVSAAANAIAAGHTSDAPTTASPNFPIAGNGGDITPQIDTAANKLGNI